MAEIEKPQTATNMPVTIHAQYVKDLSFENPNAPDSLRAGKEPPQINVEINMDVRAIDKEGGQKNLYEVVLNAKGEAKRGSDVAFLIEVFYGVLVEVGESVHEDKVHPLLMIEIPKLAFPFVRKIISDNVTEGGFPTFMISPIDFHALYMQKFAGDVKKEV